jgi:hypothetical protein
VVVEVLHKFADGGIPLRDVAVIVPSARVVLPGVEPEELLGGGDRCVRLVEPKIEEERPVLVPVEELNCLGHDDVRRQSFSRGGADWGRRIAVGEFDPLRRELVEVRRAGIWVHENVRHFDETIKAARANTVPDMTWARPGEPQPLSSLAGVQAC